MAILTYREAIAGALREELARDDRVFVIGERVGYSGGAGDVTAAMLAEFGERRIRDTPRLDLSLVGAAIGAAMGGLVPIVAMRDAALAIAAGEKLRRHPRLPIVIRAPLGGDDARDQTEYGGAGWIHGGGTTPRVLAPASPSDAAAMLKAAIRADGPCVIFEDRRLYETRGKAANATNECPALEGARIVRIGADLTIVAYAGAVQQAAAASEILAAHQIAAEVIDLRALAPLDCAALAASIAKTGRAIIASAGLAGADAEIASIIHHCAFAALRTPLETVTPIGAGDIVRVAMRRG